MKIKKILNRNIVLAMDERDRECVLAGCGLAFGKKVGDEIESAQIERIFTPRGTDIAEKLSRIVEDIPMEHIEVADEIIKLAKRELPYELDEKIYLTLMDHVSFALRRHSEGMDLTSSLKWEMKQCYPREYRAGLLALDVVERLLGMRLPEDEAAFIAFHFISAGAADNHEVQRRMEMIHDILDIIRAYFNIDFDEETLSYQRFITHLNYFSRRVFGIAPLSKPPGGDDELWHQLSATLKKEAACAQRISAYVEKRFKHVVTREEESYLMVHLHSMLSA